MRFLAPPSSLSRFLASLLALAAVVAGCSVPPKSQIPSREYQGRTRIACIGDSITAGAGLQNPADAAYPAVLGKLMGPAYEVRNFGVSGSTLSKDGDLSYWNTPSYIEALEFLPQVVIIALGTNDSKPQNWRFKAGFERDLYAMVRVFEGLPSLPTVYLCTPPPVFQDRWGINEAVVRGEIRPLIRKVAARELLPVIDLHRGFIDREEMFPDGIHPDALGAASIAAMVESALRGL